VSGMVADLDSETVRKSDKRSRRLSPEDSRH
jgi:hypothetical protein